MLGNVIQQTRANLTVTTGRSLGFDESKLVQTIFTIGFVGVGLSGVARPPHTIPVHLKQADLRQIYGNVDSKPRSRDNHVSGHDLPATKLPDNVSRSPGGPSSAISLDNNQNTSLGICVPINKHRSLDLE